MPIEYDIVIRNVTIYDGGGAPPFRGDVALQGDRIAAIGPLPEAQAGVEIDAQGLAVAPGFINILSHAQESLIVDGRSQSDIRQGITLEVMGEGRSMGPVNDQARNDLSFRGAELPFEFEWTTLAEYLEYLERRGVSTNVASFVGATTLRVHELGQEDRRPSPDELDRMCNLVRQAMEEGAVGISSALMQVPGPFADTAELTELAKAAAEYDGLYISHLRFTGARFLDAIEELITISQEAGIRGEVYHFGVVGRENVHLLDSAIELVEKARAEGLEITGDVYSYNAGSGGLTAAMPPWVGEGGHEERVKRLTDPAIRKRVAREMLEPSDEWENLYLAVGGPTGYMVVGLKNPELKHLNGKTVAEIGEIWGTSPEEAAMDLIVKDNTRVMSVGFSMNAENVRKKIPVPWMSFLYRLALDGDRGYLHRIAYPSPCLRQLPACAGEVRARREGDDDRRSHPQDDVAAGPDPPARPPRNVEGGLLRRRGRIQSRDHPRSRHLPAAPPVLHRHPPCARQRGTSAERWRAYGRKAGGALFAGLAGRTANGLCEYLVRVLM